MATNRRKLKQQLAAIDPERDCVAIFKPNKGVAFYIPDYFADMIKAEPVREDGTRELPTYVLAVLLHVHLLKYQDSDPTIREFIDKVKDQIILDLRTQGTDYTV